MFDLEVGSVSLNHFISQQIFMLLAILTVPHCFRLVQTLHSWDLGRD